MPVLVLFLIPYASADVAEYSDPHSRILTVGSEIDYPPFADVDGSGKPIGFSVDLIKAVAKAVNLRIEFETGPWNRVRKKLEDGQVDLLPLVGYSAARDEVFDFTSTHTSNMSIFLTRDGAVELAKFDDSRDHKIIVMESDSTHDYLIQQGLTDQLLLATTVNQALQRLIRADADLAFLPEIPAYLSLKETGADNITKTGNPIDVFYGKGFSFAVREGNSELRHLLNAGLKIVELEGQYEKIYEKWFGSVIPKANAPSPYLQYLPIAVVIISSVLVVLLGGIVLLRRKVAEQTHELLEHAKTLEQQNTDLVKLNAELGQFAHATSHDLKAPLKSITGQLALLQDLFADSLPERGVQLAKNIDISVSRMVQMIDGLLEYAELSSVNRGRESVDVSKLVDSVVSDLEGDVIASGAVLDKCLHTLGLVQASAPVLRQIFKNLILNAIKYKKPVGVLNIKIAGSEHPDYWEFSVTDNGLGIEGKFHERIFKLFQRLHTQSDIEGIGLGLNLCQKGVASHGGTISLESVPGEGSKFSFTLKK